MSEWDNTDKSDHIVAYRQTRSPLWNAWLQNLEKKAEFKSLLQNPDITKFQDIVSYEGKSEKEKRKMKNQNNSTR